jgi:threonine 3-dehydrogenase
MARSPSTSRCRRPTCGRSRPDPSELAAFFDPYGNAAHCALEFDVIGEDVLITGAGPIGIIAAGICKHIGARNVVVTDVNDYRLKLAADMGATRVVNVANSRSRT